MENKSMTAIEWLVKEISAILGPLQTKPMTDLLLVDAIHKAKEMEEKQKRDSYDKGHYDASTYYCNMDEE
jgi:multisubunit Na+/H+ antiporter MnhG subunit